MIDPFKSDRFVRFHAFQSIFFNVAWIGFWIVWMIARNGAGRHHEGAFLPHRIAGQFAAHGWRFLPLGFSHVQPRHRAKTFKLPIIGAIAAKQAGL